eukprot:1255057-Ditylum_brightwellii.AAC.1
MYVWVQKSAEEIELLQKDGKLPEGTIGYHFETMLGQIMMELHVDSYKEFVLDMLKNSKYDDNLSIRKDSNIKPSAVLGQDEVIFKKDSFSYKGWKIHNCQTILLPKTEGEGLMVLAL